MIVVYSHVRSLKHCREEKRRSDLRKRICHTFGDGWSGKLGIPHCAMTDKHLLHFLFCRLSSSLIICSSTLTHSTTIHIIWLSLLFVHCIEHFSLTSRCSYCQLVYIFQPYAHLSHRFLCCFVLPCCTISNSGTFIPNLERLRTLY